MAAKAAPSALVATRAADGGCSPGHASAPQRPTGTEDGQDRGRSARRTTRLRTGRCSPGGWCPALCGCAADGGTAGGSAYDRVSLIDVIRQPVEQPVDIPVRAWDGTGGHLQDFLCGHFSSSSVEQIVDIPVPHGGPHLQDPGLASLPQEVAGEVFLGGFSTLPRRKKCEDWSALGVVTAPRVEPIHAGSSFRPVLGG